MLAPILAIGLCSTFGLSHADSPLDKADAKAADLFRSVAAAYKALPSYSDHGEFGRSIRLGGRPRVEKSPLSFKFTKPNRILLDAGEVRVVGDGKTLTTILGPTKRFLTADAKATLDPITIADGPAGAILLGGASGPPAQVLLKLLVGTEPAAAFPDRATGLKAEDDRTVEGKTFGVLRIEMGEEPALRLLIDPQTKLIRRMEYALEGKNDAAKLPKSAGELTEMAISWDGGEIQTAVLPDTAFKFEAPVGFTKVKVAEAAKTVETKKNEMIGQLAPDFTLTVLDGDGRTKKISRADLAGKVVVIDFWATWCGPCLVELPEIQVFVETLADKGKTGVIFLAVSEDRNPEDGSSVRKLVEDLLKSKSIEMDKPPLSRVALDPGQETGDAFKVESLPTLIVLDTKGVVHSVRVGLEDGLKDSLLVEIEALLAGKPVAGNEAKKVKD